ncbi:MAG: hypothetical protein HUN05_12560 [Desulfobacter sp.]|nr:MAG: hypothetical protein HUN05_12560 [Desulfobacter sp.]
MNGRIKKTVYGFILFFITLTGFAQMPIFKRYYIADIPGLGWLAQFYVTHAIHYILAFVLLGFGLYVAADVQLNGKGIGSLSLTGRLRTGLILGLMVSGGFMVVRNLAGVYFSHTSIHLMNLFHVGFCMALLGVTLFALVTRKNWTV